GFPDSALALILGLSLGMSPAAVRLLCSGQAHHSRRDEGRGESDAAADQAICDPRVDRQQSLARRGIGTRANGLTPGCTLSASGVLDLAPEMARTKFLGVEAYETEITR